MSGFDAGWLALREPHDNRARNRDLVEALKARIDPGRELVLCDLGSGTGSTRRALGPLLPCPQAWHMIEHDPALVEAGRDAADGIAGPCNWIEGDLAADLDALVPRETQLITASAFLDLVSEAWLERLAEIAAARRLSVYIALTYDGALRWRPGDLFDATMLELFNRHQHGEKNFGPALGPDAAPALAGRLEAAGFEVALAPSPWTFGPDDKAIQSSLLDGYRGAALELAPERQGEIDDWHAARKARIERGQSRHRVGHLDLLAFPGSGPVNG